MTLTLTHLDANGTDPGGLLASDFAGGSPLDSTAGRGQFWALVPCLEQI